MTQYKTTKEYGSSYKGTFKIIYHGGTPFLIGIIINKATQHLWYCSQTHVYSASRPDTTMDHTI